MIPCSYHRKPFGGNLLAWQILNAPFLMPTGSPRMFRAFSDWSGSTCSCSGWGSWPGPSSSSSGGGSWQNSAEVSARSWGVSAPQEAPASEGETKAAGRERVSLRSSGAEFKTRKTRSQGLSFALGTELCSCAQLPICPSQSGCLSWFPPGCHFDFTLRTAVLSISTQLRRELFIFQIEKFLSISVAHRLGSAALDFQHLQFEG